MSVALAMLLAAVALSGCGAQAIVVSEAAITDDPDKRVVGWTADEAPRLVFSPEDEEVTLRALFDFNYRGVYEWYKVEWIAPDGSPYKVVSLRTDFGSHRDIKASLKIRSKMASRLPGVWRARLWLLGREGEPDRLLVSRLFRIAEPTEAQRLAGLTPVDAPTEGAPRPLAQTSTARAVPPQAASPAPGKLAAPPVPGSRPPTKTSSGSAGAAPPEGASQGALAPAPATAPEFPVLPPLAVMVPGRSGTTATAPAPAPARAGAPAAGAGSNPGASSVSAGSTPKPPAQTPQPRTVKPLAGGTRVPSVFLTSKPATGPSKPPPVLRSYPGCPPMYYPPGPGCIEEAPQE